jgi:hypothetical protein
LINNFELIQEDRDLDELEFKTWEDLILKLDTIYNDEEIYWHQRTSLHWLLEGDNNTNFFHTLVNHRKRKNLIFSLEINNITSFDQT